MIHPDDRRRELWDLVVLATSVTSALVLPPAAVFGFFRSTPVILLSVLATAIFSIDIVFGFSTAFVSQGRLVEDRQRIAERYLSGHFVADFIAAFPLWILVVLFAPSVDHWSRLLILNVLVKLFRMNRILRKLGGSAINPAILRLFLLVFWILLAAHLIACGWVFMGAEPDAENDGTRYLRSFYWTITTLTTIGYGDITPSTNPQTLFVIIIELLGAGMYGLVIGNIANLIANIDVAKTQYREKLDKINAFLKYRNVPGDLQRKINDYYDYLWESRRGYDESSVLGDLPDPLKVSVSLQLNKEIIEKVPIFENASDDLIRDIIMNLTPVVFTPGDYIVKSGELGYDMYFISKGSVDVVSADEKTTYATLTSGQFFGEIALLLSMPRTATIIAKEYCDFYRFDKETFDRVLTRHPGFAQTIQELAEGRRAEIEKIAVRKTEAANAGGPANDAAPAQVTGLSGEYRGHGIVVTWDAPDRTSHFEIVRKDSRGDSWHTLSDNLTTATYTDERTHSGKPNTYRVRAVGIAGPGAWSEPITVKKPRR